MKLSVQKGGSLQNLLLENKELNPAKIVFPLVFGRWVLYQDDPYEVLDEIGVQNPRRLVKLFIKAGLMLGTVENPRFNPKLDKGVLPPRSPATGFLEPGRDKVADGGIPTKENRVNKMALYRHFIDLLRKNKADQKYINDRKKMVVISSLIKRKISCERLKALMDEFFIVQSRKRDFSTEAFFKYARQKA